MIIAFLLALAGIWLFGDRIRRLRFSRDDEAGRKFANSFRMGAMMIAIAAFLIGSLYRLHILSFIQAFSLYIPVALGFFWGLRWLQPYLQDAEEETDHDGRKL